MIADFINGIAIGFQVLCCARFGTGTFAKHIEGESCRYVIIFMAASESFGDGSAENILSAHNFHSLHHGGTNNGLTQSGSKTSYPVIGILSDLSVQHH